VFCAFASIAALFAAAAPWFAFKKSETLLQELCGAWEGCADAEAT